VAGTQYAVDLVFRTQGGKQLKDASKQINKVSDAAKKTKKSTGQAANGIRKLGLSTKVAAGGFKSLGVAVYSTLAPLALITAAIAGVGKAFNAASEKEKQFLALQQGLENLGVQGTDVLDALAQKATEFGEATLFSPADFREAATSLTSFRNIAVKDYEDVIEMSANVAQAMGQDIKGASLQLAKALNAPTIGITALNRSGIQFTETQKAQIKEMEKAGDIAGAQALIMKELSAQYNGVAESAGKGLAGQFDLLGQRIQEAFEDLGEFLGPILGPAMEGAIFIIDKFAEVWDYIQAVIFPKVVEAFKPISDQFKDGELGKAIETISGAIQGFLITALEGAVAVLAGMSRTLALVLQAFKRLTDNPVFKFIADQVGRLANLLGLSGNKVEEFNEKQNKTKKDADKVLNAVKSTVGEQENSIDAEKERAEAAKKTTQAFQEGVSAIEQQASAQESLAGAAFSLTQQRLQTEQTINGILLEQANSQLQNAQNQQQRQQAAVRIYQLTVQQARLERQSAMAGVAETLRKKQAQMQTLELKAREIAAEVALARAKGVATKEHEKALSIARGAVELAEQQLGIQQQIAGERVREINAIYESKELAAELAYQQNLVADNTQRAASAAGSLAGNMSAAAASASSAASAAASAASAAGSAGGPGGFELSEGTYGSGASYQFGGAAANHPHFQKIKAQKLAEFDNRHFSNPRKADRELNDVYAELMTISSNYNKRVTKGQADEARNSWNQVMGGGGKGGRSGSATINVNTGPVMNMDGQNYVSQGDFVQGLQIAAEEGASLALEAIQGSGETRRSSGIG